MRGYFCSPCRSLLLPALLALCCACSDPNGEKLVWITDNHCYHTKQCTQVSRNTRMVRQHEAETLGYSLCTACGNTGLPGTASASAQTTAIEPEPGVEPASPGALPVAPPAEEAPQLLGNLATRIYHRPACPEAFGAGPVTAAQVAQLGLTPCPHCIAQPTAAPLPRPASRGPQLVIPGQR